MKPPKLPACPHCTEDRQIELVGGGWYVCGCCAKPFKVQT